MSTKNITVRVDEELKKQAEELFNDLGLGMTAAITAFLKQAVREQRVPLSFSLKPNATTYTAMQETNDILYEPTAYRHYHDVDSMFEEILNEET